MWTYNYTADYITERVAAASSNPLTFGYRTNDTACEAGNYTTVRAAQGTLLTLGRMAMLNVDDATCNAVEFLQ